MVEQNSQPVQYLKKINKNNFKKTQKQKYLSNTQIIKIFFPRL
jgi:hypothetical protein